MYYYRHTPWTLPRNLPFTTLKDQNYLNLFGYIKEVKFTFSGELQDELNLWKCRIGKNRAQILYRDPKTQQIIGKSGATSELSDEHRSENAFLSVNSAWVTGANSLPATIWYDFTRQVYPISFSLFSRESKQYPDTFEFVGSNDCSSWQILKTVSDTGFSDGQQKEWELGCSARKAYSCYGIRITNRWSRDGIVTLAQVRMYTYSDIFI